MFFSIVIPTFNRENLITQTINSILNQTFTDFEIIVIDDGSKDKTEEVVKLINSDKIKYYKIENSGIGYARNKGINYAKGNYIGFLDSDDLYYNNHLQNAYNFIKSLNSDEIIHLNFNLGNREQTIYFKNKLPNKLPDDLFKNCSFHVNSLFIPNTIANITQFNEDRNLMLSEDWEYFIRLATRYPIHILDIPSSYLVQHNERTTRKYNPEGWINRTNSMTKYLKEDPIISTKYSHLIPISIAQINSLNAVNFAFHKYKIKAIKHWIISLKLNYKEFFTRRTLAIIKHLLFSW
ncbi:MAG: glycosyltransferase [Bacteroidetes bacterium]|nr:glycosyltransferase [Bacteroidota bacterium]